MNKSLYAFRVRLTDNNLLDLFYLAEDWQNGEFGAGRHLQNDDVSCTELVHRNPKVPWATGEFSLFVQIIRSVNRQLRFCEKLPIHWIVSRVWIPDSV